MILNLKKKYIKIFDYLLIQKGKYQGFIGKSILTNNKIIIIVLNNPQKTICVNKSNVCLI